MNSPTEPTAKEKVLAWVREAVPESMELKFGCIVKYVYPMSHHGILGEFTGKDGCKNSQWGIAIDNCVMPIPNQNHFLKNVEILGRPLRLEDLLIALEAYESKKFKGDTKAPYLDMWMDGSFTLPDGMDGRDIVATYDLHKTLEENLENPELTDFLYELLSPSKDD